MQVKAMRSLVRQALRAINPRQVCTSIRGFGDKAGGESPCMHWPSFDIVAQAMGGWIGICGLDAEHPMKVGGSAGDTVPGLFAAFGSMTALWHARATGEGQYVDIAMARSVLALSELVVAAHRASGQRPEHRRTGRAGQALAHARRRASARPAPGRARRPRAGVAA